MTAPHDAATALQAVIARLEAEKQELADRLTRRDVAYEERMAHQAATSAVLKAMAASPGDPQPVFEQIVEQARIQCSSMNAFLWTYDGMLHCRAASSSGMPDDQIRAYLTNFPMPLERVGNLARSIREQRVMQIRDAAAEPGMSASGRRFGARSGAAVPLVRDSISIGLIGLSSTVPGGYTDSQIELLKTFAEQAVIAITSAETYRALQDRTSALAVRNSEYGERIEHQAATIDVLKAMSASPGDPQPVFDLICVQSMTICNSDSCGIYLRNDGLVDVRALLANGVTPDELKTVMSQYPMPLRPESPLGVMRSLTAGTIVHVRDADVDEPGAISSAAQRLGVRSGIYVPLVKDDRAIGVIALADRQPGGYSKAQVDLLKTFAEQAVIAITSAETYEALQTRTADLQEALEQQTATSEVLKVISRSTFDLHPVLNVVAETAGRLCAADQAAIFERDGDTVHLAANQGFPPEYEVKLKEPGVTPPLSSRQPLATHRAINEGRVVHIPDVAAVPDYAAAAITLGQQRTTLGVPLLREGEPIGAIVLARRRVEPFADRHIELVCTFADQAAIAMENARLLTEQREALEQQTATAEVLRVINESPGDLTPVFDALLDNALRLCKAPFGGLYVRGGMEARGVAVRGMPPAYAAFRRDHTISLTRREHPLARCMDTRQPVEIADVATDESIYPEDRPVLMELAGVRSILDVPLVKDGKGIGAIAIYQRTPGRFPKAQIALLENFAAQAVIAMENARLLTEQREALEQQTATAEVLQVINANPGNVTPVFETILEKAHSLCGATLGSLMTYDGEFFQAEAVHGFPDEHVNLVRKPFRPNSDHQRLIEGDRLVHLPDVRKLEIAPDDEVKMSTAGRTEVRTLLAVPLRKDGALLGFISACRPEVRPFSDKEINLLENFAAQAVIAMENARLLDELRQRQEELRVTFENMGDGVALFDETHHLVAWNRRFQNILDVPDDAFVERPSFADYIRYLAGRGEFGPHADPEEHVHRLQAGLGQSLTFERTRSNRRVIEVRQNPVEDGGFVLIYADITERKRSEEELRAARDAAEAAYRHLKAAQANLIQAEKMASLGQLTAGIAHEIKNPLNFVNNFAELSVELIDELKELAAPAVAALDGERRADVEDIEATLASNLEKIVEHGKRADSIVKSMLEHSRGASGERRRVDINKLVDEALNLAYHGARAQDQSFNVTLERDFGSTLR